jgi:hypothetical protein
LHGGLSSVIAARLALVVRADLRRHGAPAHAPQEALPVGDALGGVFAGAAGHCAALL